MTNKWIARTGRVQDWIDNPTHRLPVSCTIIDVEDSVQEGRDSIEQSWLFASYALRNAAGVAVHVDRLRPKGTTNSHGLCASGPVSFLKIYSVLNETLRRGGVYKGGAIVGHITLDHPDILEFINAPRAELPWIKRCVNLNQEMWDNCPEHIRDALLHKMQTGDIWLAKIKYDQHGERIRFNVCLEVALKSRGTCLLQHINASQCEPEELEEAFVQGMTELCELHGKTGVDKDGMYLSPAEDRQVGLGILGLANMLARLDITYADFGKALSALRAGEAAEITPAYKLARCFERAINEAANVARSYNMDRCFTIAPTASCSFRYKDPLGYTTCPEIAPPISRLVDRDSGTQGVLSVDYGPVEIASEVTYPVFREVADGLVGLMHDTGLFHGYSLNHWSDMIEYNYEFVQEWLDSPQSSLYYALQVAPDTLRKDDVTDLLDDDYADIFNFTQDTEDFCVSCAE
jgi:hypothetical protein